MTVSESGASYAPRIPESGGGSSTSAIPTAWPWVSERASLEMSSSASNSCVALAAMLSSAMKVACGWVGVRMPDWCGPSNG